MNIDLIFVTTSPRRRSILKDMNIKCSFIKPADTEEINKISKKKPETIAILNAKNKVLSIDTSSKYKNSLLIGVDTIVYINSKLLGKPENLSAAE